MSYKHQERPVELAMRVYERVKTRASHNSDFLMCDMADGLVEEFGMSRATAFRYIRTAIDVLGISYGMTNARSVRIGERKSEGHSKAKMTGYPNGRPGPKAAVYS